MAKGLPGYPSGKAIRKQAAALANAAVPTKRSITGPYNQGIEDTTSFTAALMHLLGQSNPGAGYDAAISQQQGVGQAAAARLAALGGQYGAGSAAAVGGLGDSALSSLIARGAAAKSFGASLPAVGAARGQLFQQGLIHDRQTALQNRGDQLRSAFTQALDQVQNQALARSTALASIQQNNRSFREGKREFGISQATQQAQFNANMAFNQQQAAQSQANWKYEHSPQWLGLQAQIQAALSGTAGGKNPLAQYTPGQITGFMKDGNEGANTAVLHGVPINQAINNLMAQGVPRQIAVSEAKNAYSQITKPLHDVPAFHNTDNTFKALQFKAAMRAYTTAVKSFKQWNFKRALRGPNYRGAPPGPPGPGMGGHK